MTQQRRFTKEFEDEVVRLALSWSRKFGQEDKKLWAAAARVEHHRRR